MVKDFEGIERQISADHKAGKPFYLVDPAGPGILALALTLNESNYIYHVSVTAACQEINMSRTYHLKVLMDDSCPCDTCQQRVTPSGN